MHPAAARPPIPGQPGYPAAQNAAPTPPPGAQMPYRPPFPGGPGPQGTPPPGYGAPRAQTYPQGAPSGSPAPMMRPPAYGQQQPPSQPRPGMMPQQSQPGQPMPYQQQQQQQHYRPPMQQPGQPGQPGFPPQGYPQQQPQQYQQQHHQQQQQQAPQQYAPNGVPPQQQGQPPAPASPPSATRRRMYPEQMARAYAGAGSPGQPPAPAPPGPGGVAAAAPYGSPNQLAQGMSQMSLSGQPGQPPQPQGQAGMMMPPAAPSMIPQQPSMGGLGGSSNSLAAPGTPQTPSGGSRSRIDPDQIPSPVAVQDNDQAQYATEPYRTCSKTIPPLASTEFRVIDEGNVSARFLRMTTYNVPCTEDLLAQSMIPLGCIVQPLAELKGGEAPIELVEPGPNGPMRCRRCRAYMNAFMQFSDGGRKFMCNFCFIQNDVPAEYFCNLDMNGRRVDIMARPELRCGVVEYAAGKEFIAKDPKPVAVVLAIDVSWNAVQSGLPAQMARIIRDWLYAENAQARFPKGAQVAILTYDRAVHFYNFHPALEQFQMLVVPDVDEMFVPLSTGFLVDPYESQPVIEQFLDALPTLFQENRMAESAVGAVAESIVSYLNDRGGRLMLFHTALPNFGPGQLKNREDPKLYGTDKEKQLFAPQDTFYKSLGEKSVGAGVCIDQYLFAFGYQDVASFGQLSAITGGECKLYPQFHLERDGARLHTDVLRSLTRQFGYNAMVRVRASSGLRVHDHFGNFLDKGTGDLELAGIDADKAFAVALKHDDKLDEKAESAIQVALLYTTAEGHRRIRVLTTSLTNTTLLGSVFRFAELDTTVNFLAKSAMTTVLSASLNTVRTQLTETCVKVLASYRKNCAASTSPGQLILPETFKLFPLFTLCLHKHKALKAGDVASDVRVAAMRELKSLPVPLSIPLLYPRLVALHTPEPTAVRVSYERLDPTGCYLVENGQGMHLWLGRNVSSDFVQGVFGVASVDQVDPRLHVLPPRDDEVNQRVQKVLQGVFARYHRHLAFHVVRQGIDQAELEFVAHMVEDKNHEAMSYVDFLVYVHRQIHSE
ncbi:COPII coat Sec23p-Sfb3p heterodimer component, partial [Allomyces arbusculus]